MGNCNKNLQPTTSTNFPTDKWQTKQSNIHSCCQILINHINPQIKVYKWLSTNPLKHNKQNKTIRQKKDKKQQYLPTIYQVGYLSDRSSIDNESNIQQQYNKYQYIITQQLIRLKDIILSQSQAVIISYSSLLAYRKMFLQFNGFIAKQNMIYINRQGIIKIWINQNLCDNYLEYPYPTITEQEFISSLLHQIFACMEDHVEYCKIYCYIKNGLICFNQVIAKLQYYMRQHGLGTMLHIPRDTFDTLLDIYQQKQDSEKSKTRLYNTNNNPNKKQQKHSKTLHQQSKLKFIVADNITQDNKKYVKDYSHKYQPEQSSRNYSYSMVNGQNNIGMAMYNNNNNINYQGNSYYCVKNYMYSNNNSVIGNQYYDV